LKGKDTAQTRGKEAEVPRPGEGGREGGVSSGSKRKARIQKCFAYRLK